MTHKQAPIHFFFQTIVAYKAPVHSSVQEEVSVKELVCTEPWPQSHPTPLGGSEPHLICISNALVAEWKQISAGLRLCEKPETRRIEVVTAAENMQCLGLCMHAL